MTYPKTEAAFIAAALASNRHVERTCHFLKPIHFQDALLRQVWAACVGLVEEGKVADVASVTAEVGFEVAPLLEGVEPAEWPEDAAKNVVEEWLELRLDLLAGDLRRKNRRSARERLAWAEATLMDLAIEARPVVTVPFGRALAEAIEIAEMKDSSKLIGIETGLDMIDRDGGLMRGELTLVDRFEVAAAIVRFLAENHEDDATHVGYRGAGEPTAIGRRTVSGGIVAWATRDRTAASVAATVAAGADPLEARHWPVHIDDDLRLSIYELRTNWRRLAGDRGLDMIVVEAAHDRGVLLDIAIELNVAVLLVGFGDHPLIANVYRNGTAYKLRHKPNANIK